MGVLNVVLITNMFEQEFVREINDFLNLNEDMIELDKTVYAITQEEYPDDEFGVSCMRKHTKYSAIFQMEGERKYP